MQSSLERIREGPVDDLLTNPQNDKVWRKLFGSLVDIHVCVLVIKEIESRWKHDQTEGMLYERNVFGYCEEV